MVKLSISNIGWTDIEDKKMYNIMKQKGFTGLEIAPTRIFLKNTYNNIVAAREWSKKLLQDFGLCVSSMQSIWYGKKERIFGSNDERQTLFDYTKKAIDFAEIIGCENLVFGCPRNRHMPEGANMETAVAFFHELGDYAFKHNCAIAIEGNPPIYNTNFLNTTKEAMDFIKLVNSKGCLLNLDTGTMIENKEDMSQFDGETDLIHHVHISEPGMKLIHKREMHKELAAMLRESNYQGFVSIEVKPQDNIESLLEVMEYVADIFQ